MNPIVEKVLKKWGISTEEKKPQPCDFCEEPAVSAYNVRVGEIPAGWDTDPKNNPDKSHMKVVRVCAAHREQASP